MLPELLREMALSAVPAVGFALLFNVPKRILPYCALGGAFARGMRLVLLKAGMPFEWATYLATAMLSLVGVYLAGVVRAHPKAFTVASIIPLIPGVSFFTTLIALVELDRQGFSPEIFSKMLAAGLRTFFTVGALALGLATPGLLFYRRRPVV